MTRLPRTFLLVLSLAAAGCVVGAPPGFSSGDSWSFPLVAPLEDGPLLVPVKINGEGPYLFKIDPDSPYTSVDAGIRSSLKLFTARARDETDERDRRVQVALAEVRTIQVGSLTVRNRKVRVHNIQTYWMGGRKIRGVLGRDVIAVSLMFAVDRDRGMGWIGKQGKLSPLEGSTMLKFRRFFGRQLKDLKVNGKKVTLHLDLGGHTSTLRVAKMKSIGGKPIPFRSMQVDELGTKHLASVAMVSSNMDLSGLTQTGLLFVPYPDKRVRAVDLDGTLGQNFFSRYNLTVNWHKKKFWLKKRSSDVGQHATTRLRRFGPAFNTCQNTACTTIKIAGLPKAPTAPAPATPAPAPTADGSAGAPAPAAQPAPVTSSVAPIRPRLELTREKMDIPSYELLIEAVDANGKSMALPWLVATMPKGVKTVVEQQIDPNYAKAASFRVIDLGPFPRDCQRSSPSGMRCVWQLAKRQ